MALPNTEVEKQKGLPDKEKKKAVLNLLLVVIAIDFLVIAAYFWLVLGIGWDPTLALIPLLGISMATGLYFAWQKGKIDNG
ncbi:MULTISPECIES: hypothetical protein [unclassified Methanoregula]|uniref:hypothetical protein n=1 Tax=unclassified Methanoregula TaxID=2649730 RepID=UPI0009CD56B7|nr:MULTISPECIES: hypothetical protein [unclassified Methanoregula]OPX63246.1 MAG: hypothetical protein A4E33_01753 [Methanoregula sp. PtaB.Bin085]OPY35008.1 MAG: hypothetical protein A4E34_01118 [Methanoregula sp. PtaU1.Bin006]